MLTNYTKLVLFFSFAATSLLLDSCSKKLDEKALLKIDPAFSSYIAAFTTGNISSEGSIRIQFSQDAIDSVSYGTPAESNLFTFSPSINGSAQWIDRRTIEFKPEKNLPHGTSYQVDFDLDKIFNIKDDKLKTFTFGFKTITLFYDIEIQGISYQNDNAIHAVRGKLIFSDVVAADQIQSIISASQYGDNLKVNWLTSENVKEHYFDVIDFTRNETESEVLINHNGKSLGIEKSGQEKVLIPSKSDFTFLSGSVVQNPDQYILLRFSDPLAENQVLDGLISCSNLDFTFEVEGNVIKAFPETRQAGNLNISINKGIKNRKGSGLNENFYFTAVFEQIKPNVRWVNTGHILPSTQGIMLPFEAVSLKSVNVEIIKIYESNVAQFFQVNKIDGQRELKRVARPVLQKVVSLESSGVSSLHKWNRYTLNLTELIATEPGAIYNVKISFKKNQSVYTCSTDSLEEDNTTAFESNFDEISENEDSYWDDYEYYYYGSGYSYSERENPCHVSYYMANKGINRNILASDLGIIAKRGKDNSINISVSDIKTALPLANVNVSILNYQQTEMVGGNTDANGLVSFKTKGKPFLVVASHNNQKGYLRVDDANALSLSHFSTSGNTTNEGVKGFIYAERGVWRPGDSLFLNFILEDKGKVLPTKLPVVLELIDPLGRTQQTIVKSKHIKGLYDFRTATSMDAPTGNWTAIVKVGNSEFRKNIQIETVKPNRLKINLDFAEEELSINQTELDGKLEVKWLHGAVAANLKAKIEAVLSPTPTHFKDFENYIFDNNSRNFSTSSAVIFDGEVDENGEATFNAGFKIQSQAPGKLTAKLKTEVFERSGNSSVDRFQIAYHPFNSYVGLMTPKGDAKRGMLLTDTNHNISIVSVDTKGKLTTGKRDVIVKLYKLEWRWWWDNSSSTSNYINTSYRSPIITGTATVQDGKGNYTLRINRPQWGRYFLEVTDAYSGHSSGKVVYIDWPGWAGKPANEASSVSVLNFDCDKASYNVGENAKINIPATPTGNALVSIENGRGVLKQFWVKTQKGNTSFDLPITAEFTPNIYVHISQIQPHNNPENNLPLRVYGIINVPVENKQTHLNPSITMVDVLEPEQKFKVQVAEASGQAMAYTLAIVDEGLLDLTRFATPQPWDYFYAHEALGVKTFDMYNDVIGAYNGAFERVLGLGGDMDGKAQESSKMNRFKPVVKVLGPFLLEKGKKAEHQIQMPYYVGSVRVMVVACNDNSAYGNAQKTVPVRKPLMVLATLPRVLGPNEEVMLPVSAFAMEEHIKSGDISIEINDLFINLEKGSKKVSFPKIGEQMAFFRLKTANKTGIAKVTVIGKSGKHSSKDVIEIEVRNPNPMVTNVMEDVLEANAKVNFSFKPFGTTGTNSGVIEVSSVPDLNLEKRLRYLIRYPHGCIEQTTSAAFPQLYLTNLIDIDEGQKQSIKNNIQGAIQRLSTFQTMDGGFSYWPGEMTSSEWGSNYAGHFLLEAQKQGYFVSETILKNWRSFQKKMANNYRETNENNSYYKYNNGLNQAYRLYTLALYQKPEIGAMNRLKEQTNLSTVANWQLAASYALAGQKETATSIINQLTIEVANYNELSNTYGSGYRDKAMLIESLLLLGKDKDAYKLMMELSGNVGSNTWMSTQTTAYSLMAISKVLGNVKKDPINFTYTLNQKDQREVSTSLPLAQVKLNEEQLMQGKLSIQSKSANQLYVRLIIQGKPGTSDSTEYSNDLILSYVYKDLEGKTTNPISLMQGTSFMVEVSVKNPRLRGEYKEMALSQTFPSGWEIVNTRMDGTEDHFNLSIPRYQDIRDDRVYTYFDLKAHEQKTFRILLNAAYAGKFYLPAVSCEAMYDASISAYRKGMWMEVLSSSAQ